jgi:hypothetical protein
MTCLELYVKPENLRYGNGWVFPNGLILQSLQRLLQAFDPRTFFIRVLNVFRGRWRLIVDVTLAFTGIKRLHLFVFPNAAFFSNLAGVRVFHESAV